MWFRRRLPLLAGLSVVASALGGAGIVLGNAGGSDSDPIRVEAAIGDWRWAPKNDLPAAEPEVTEEPAEQPAAEVPASQPRAQTRSESADDLDVEDIPEVPKVADSDDEISRAEVLENGIALPPLGAPPAVRAILDAGNSIARHPYKWGGGHGRWQDTGYDCSGSVSYALYAGGLLDGPMASGGYMKWGKPGKGKWVTIYANPGHMFMVVAGVRFDTSAAKEKARSRWTNDLRPTGGYAVRHPPGL